MPRIAFIVVSITERPVAGQAVVCACGEIAAVTVGVVLITLV